MTIKELEDILQQLRLNPNVNDNTPLFDYDYEGVLFTFLPEDFKVEEVQGVVHNDFIGYAITFIDRYQ